MKVFIPTLKRTDHSLYCVPSKVHVHGLTTVEKPCDEILKAAYYCYKRDSYPDEGKYEFVVALEEIHCQHHYSGDKLVFLKKFKLYFMKGYGYVLTNVNGAIFQKLADKEITINEAIESANKKTDYDYSPCSFDV